MSSQVLREHPQLMVNQILKKTYRIAKVLGWGTFSVVYQCLNLETKQKLALKIGFPGQGQKMLLLQKKVYRLLSSNQGGGFPESGFATYYQFGKTQNFNYLILERLSVSIEEIFVKLYHKFSIKTVLNIGLQAIGLIQKVHKIGYIHRDIKPANLLLGHGPKKDHIYLIDFGLAKKISDPQSSSGNRANQREQVQGKQFVGTKRFASIASHLGYSQSKKDDLESLGYTLIFLLKGRLPWQGLKLASRSQKHEMIGKIKQEIDLEQFCRLEIKDQICYQGEVFLKLFRYLRVLNFGDTPNYQFLKKLFIDEIAFVQKKQAEGSTGFSRWSCNGKFDWMDAKDPNQEEINKKGKGRAETPSKKQGRDSVEIDRGLGKVENTDRLKINQREKYV